MEKLKEITDKDSPDAISYQIKYLLFL